MLSAFSLNKKDEFTRECVIKSKVIRVTLYNYYQHDYRHILTFICIYPRDHSFTHCWNMRVCGLPAVVDERLQLARRRDTRGVVRRHDQSLAGSRAYTSSSSAHVCARAPIACFAAKKQSDSQKTRDSILRLCDQETEPTAETHGSGSAQNQVAYCKGCADPFDVKRAPVSRPGPSTCRYSRIVRVSSVLAIFEPSLSVADIKGEKCGISQNFNLIKCVYKINVLC